MDQTYSSSGPRFVQTLIPLDTLPGDGVMVGALAVGGEDVADGGRADAVNFTTGLATDVGYKTVVGGKDVAAGAVVERTSTVGVPVGSAVRADVEMAFLAVVGVAIRAVVAVGKKASVSAALAICVATSGSLAFSKGVTVGRGVLVGTGAADVQPANIARLLIMASRRRIIPPVCVVLPSAYTSISQSQ